MYLYTYKTSLKADKEVVGVGVHICLPRCLPVYLASVLLLSCFCFASVLLLLCFCTASVLLLCCFSVASVLLLCCFCLASVLLLCCFFYASVLLQFCLCVAYVLLLFCFSFASVLLLSCFCFAGEKASGHKRSRGVSQARTHPLGKTRTKQTHLPRRDNHRDLLIETPVKLS